MQMRILILNGSTMHMVNAFKQGAENAGIFTSNGDANQSKVKWDELYRFGKSL